MKTLLAACAAVLMGGGAVAQDFRHLGTDLTIEGYWGRNTSPFSDLDTKAWTGRVRTDMAFGQFGLQIDLSHSGGEWDYVYVSNTHLIAYPWYQVSPNTKIGLFIGAAELPRYKGAPTYEPLLEYGVAVVGRAGDNWDYQFAYTRKPRNEHLGRDSQEFEVYGRYRFGNGMAATGELFTSEIDTGSSIRYFSVVGLGAEYAPDGGSVPNLTYFAKAEFLRTEQSFVRDETRLRLGITLAVGTPPDVLPKFQHNDFIRESYSWD